MKMDVKTKHRRDEFIMSKRPELTAAERALPYAKFYRPAYHPHSGGEAGRLAAGPIDPSLALKIEDRNDLFKPGDPPCEIGYCVMPKGTGSGPTAPRCPA